MVCGVWINRTVAPVALIRMDSPPCTMKRVDREGSRLITKLAGSSADCDGWNQFPISRNQKNLESSAWDGSGLQGCRLQGFGLQGCGLQGCRLQGCRLQGCRLQGCRLQGCGLQGCRLQGCGL